MLIPTSCYLPRGPYISSLVAVSLVNVSWIYIWHATVLTPSQHLLVSIRSPFSKFWLTRCLLHLYISDEDRLQKATEGLVSGGSWEAWGIISQALPMQCLRFPFPSVTWTNFACLVMERGESLLFTSSPENLWPCVPLSPGRDAVYCYNLANSQSGALFRVIFWETWFCISEIVLGAAVVSVNALQWASEDLSLNRSFVIYEPGDNEQLFHSLRVPFPPFENCKITFSIFQCLLWWG